MRQALLVVFLSLLFFLWQACGAAAVMLDLEQDFGAIPNDSSHENCRRNTQILSNALQYNTSNHTLVIPHNKTFFLELGVFATNVNNAVIQLDGTLRFERLDKKPIRTHKVQPCMHIKDSQNLTITSSSAAAGGNRRGLIDGRGSQYWGVPGVGFIQVAEHRPRLLVLNRTTDLLLEHIILQDSPYHTLKLVSVNRVEVRNISIVARRTPEDGHGWIDLSAFNTDGIDVSGHNVHVHDVDIWTQDDCIAVKDNKDPLDYVSSNMTFERINASGTGIVIGSIGGSHVRNITFRDCYLHKSVKGIYLKFHEPEAFWKQRNLTGIIENVMFENIGMEETLQFSIFMGPAQQSDRRDPCFPNPCSLCWPWSPTAKCHVVREAKFRNITLRNVTMHKPAMSPGVILGDAHDPTLESIVFENVIVTKNDPLPYAQEERTVTFPGLKQPIHDNFVPEDYYNYEYFDSGYEQALVATTTAVERRRRRFLRQKQESLLQHDHQDSIQESDYFYDDDDESMPYYYHNYAYDTNLTRRRHPFHKPKWTRTSSYFRCTGVVNGVATGKTWPIPGCFAEPSL